MTDTKSTTTAADAPEGLQPLSGLNLLGGDTAGLCSGGVCHLPSPSEKAD